MAFAMAALAGVAGTVEIDDPACVAVSYVPFWHDVALVSSTVAASPPSVVQT
jgi:5-enolpyruvylshikimate-3-phosphate synthase